MDIKDQFVKIVENFLSSVKKERSLSMSSIYTMIYSKMYESDAYGYLTDVYRDDSGALFAVISDNGKLFKSEVFIEGTDVTMGEKQEVMIEFSPISRSFHITRSDDGTVRWLTVSATSVLTKSGEIDSTALFDSFVDAVNRGAKYPYRTFFHKGEQFRTGQCDFVAREGYALITSGIYDDSEIAKAEIQARSNEPDYWGDSIQYLPTEDPEIMEVSDGITIPVYRSGVLEEISTLPNDHADGYYTNKAYRQEVKRAMNKREKDALIKLFNGDEEKAKSWLQNNVDEINRSIVDSGQIARSTEEEAESEIAEVIDEVEEEEENTSEVETEDSEETPVTEIELDDDTIDVIVDRMVASSKFDEVIASKFQELGKAIDQVSRDLNEFRASQIKRAKDVDEEIKDLKVTAEDKVSRMVEDLPRSAVVRATYRPSRQAPQSDGEEDEPKSLAQIAEETVALLEN